MQSPAENSPFKISSHFCPIREANFCSSIKLSVVSLAPRSGSKIWGIGGESEGGGGGGGVACGQVCYSKPTALLTLCLAGNENLTILQ